MPAGKPLVVLVPGTIWETKHWTIEGFAGVAREFLQQGFAVALAGTKRDEARCEQIAAAAPGTINLCGKTTPADLAALIQRSELAVTNDSGSMHVAAALGKPMVSVFGPTNPVHIGPYERPESVVRVDLPCSPCNYRRLSQCPFDHACMDDAICHDQESWALENSPDALANAIEDSSDRKLSAMGKNAARVARSLYSWPRVFDELFCIYRELRSEYRQF